ncbi:uncharacterized protein LOC130988053 [Salvia miltiorrhiza]|uniref:uncharacterized protein LOC130988053 n=1 Tax=Salvia miltiorrhiza TaxID=226208 RepID=UPI0025AC6588|nr:uncharacterized protein LOC130988053 [Salvia miltiorrhiza]XP_057767791.1 uncharacterized protein LOC130988053 [Salvia miltiorrhiza]XP_057767792.1 uncharacterized protein LOC130988053 [Salvia miltiorrhiza]XP_057767793.1 uncharacterized protein LOC130988053 [Salvia miltiorrhiza]XP_057767794.1 uncharacterized protein LOC130988053 [Salvia miltiorrhiza]
MMANSCTVMSQSEITSLKDALCAQQKLLQKLYNELEAEREASATAASEALSVILRLQGEKAAVKMEAEQYKRLAEERMCHAEESFALIEDMITEKEMEVAELDYQVQTYKYQLMSMGFDVPSSDDIAIPENLFHRNECLAGETSLHSKCKKALFELESSTSADLDFSSKPVEEEQLGHETNEFASFVSDSEKLKFDTSAHDQGMSSYAEQIKDLEVRIKEMTGADVTGFMSEAPTPAISKRSSAANLPSLPNLATLLNETRIPSQLSTGTSYEPNKLGVVDDIGQIKHPGNPSETTKAVHSPRPPTIHDVFEVPQVEQEPTSCESSSEDRQKEASEDNELLEIQVEAHPESVKQITKDEPDWMKKLVQSTDDEVRQVDQESTGKDGQEEVCEASEILESQDVTHPESVKKLAKNEPDWLKKLLESAHHEKNLCKPSDVAAIDRGIVQPTTSVAVAFVSESNLDKPEMSQEIIEGERPAQAQSSERDEELKLLKKIWEKLNLLQNEIVLQKVKKSIAEDEPSLQPLAEMMVSFWL